MENSETVFDSLFMDGREVTQTVTQIVTQTDRQSHRQWW